LLAQEGNDRLLAIIAKSFYDPWFVIAPVTPDQQKSAQMNQGSMLENGIRIGRIEQTFMKVRTEISVRCHLQHDWFKVPNGNGTGSF
jgi:hypothetical protein